MVVKVEIFVSQSCPYCPMAIEAADKVKSTIGDGIEIEKLDVSENPDKIKEYDIMSVPVIAINGKVVFTGVPTEEELQAAVTSRMDD
ncbi:MAG: thioredoxin family protein [Methanobacteriaceae archaeon]|nr:thioredoxin family protein [Methanobacteriaceae archaeon]